MKITRSRALAVTVSALAALGLTACGGGTEASDAKTGTLTFWNPLVGDDGAYMRQIVDDYNATKPAFKVRFQTMAEGDMYTKVYSVLNSGKGVPDVMLMHADRLAGFASADMVEPVDSLAAKQPKLAKANYLDAAWDAGQVDGKQYGIPLDLHGVVTFYNKDLVTKYGAEHFLDDKVITVDEVLSLKGKLPKGTYAFPSLFAPGLVQNWVYSQGTSATGANDDVDLTATPYKKAFEALVELQRAGLLAPEDADAAKVFNSGKSLFIPDGTWGISSHEAIKGLDFGITNALALSADNPLNVMGSHQFAMLRSTERGANRVAGVAAFVEYVRTHSDKWANAGQVVASKETFESPGYAKHLQSYLTSDESEQKMLVIDNHVNTPYVMQALWENSKDVVYGKIGIDPALTKMQKEVQGKIEQSGQG